MGEEVLNKAIDRACDYISKALDLLDKHYEDLSAYSDLEDAYDELMDAGYSLTALQARINYKEDFPKDVPYDTFLPPFR